MWFMFFWGLGLASAVVHLSIIGFAQSLSTICSIFLLHQFVVAFGLVGLGGIIINIAIADYTSTKLGWPGGPYQIKYGFCQAHLGIIGVLSIWFRGSFWVASLVTMYMYCISGVWTHLGEMIKNSKADTGNVCNMIMVIVYVTFITVLSVLAGNVWHL